MLNYLDYFRKDGTQDRELIELLEKAYQQGRADVLNWLKDNGYLMCNKNGDYYDADEIAEELKDQKNENT